MSLGDAKISSILREHTLWMYAGFTGRYMDALTQMTSIANQLVFERLGEIAPNEWVGKTAYINAVTLLRFAADGIVPDFVNGIAKFEMTGFDTVVTWSVTVKEWCAIIDTLEIARLFGEM